jgi:predicted nucleic acid-binding protein
MARIEREGRVATLAVERAWNLLHTFRQKAHEIQPSNEIRPIAQDLLLKYPLRAADALQLAAALSWYDDAPRRAFFVALDNRLRTAALLEGFQVLPFMDEVHEASAEWETVGPILTSRIRLPGI